MHKDIFTLINFIKSKDGITSKSSLIKEVKEKFGLTQDRTVYYCGHYAIRFSFSSSTSFSNTVISLSHLQKYDDIPFMVCLVTPNKNILYLANSTFIKKVSHSSQRLRTDNIKGSINGSDIFKELNGLKNEPQNFEELYATHIELGFSENLPRLVEATTGISPSGKKFQVNLVAKNTIKTAVERAIEFTNSEEYRQLKLDLDNKVNRYKNEILYASFIENVNIRGRFIEYLIAGQSEQLKKELIKALKNGQSIPKFKTNNELGDYTKIFNKFHTATDVKTKIMVLKSNPKAYNIDKLLEFLSKEKSIFMFYFVGIEPDKILNQILISMFQKDLLKSTIIQPHWAGRNSRGVAQFQGTTLDKLLNNPNNTVDIQESSRFLDKIISL